MKSLGTLTFALLFAASVATIHAQAGEGWNQAWKLGGANSDISYDITTDDNNNFILTGNFYGQLSLPSGDYETNGQSDVLVAKYDQNGLFQWAHAFGGSSNDMVLGVDTDSAGNVYVTGYFTGNVNFGNANSLTARGSNDIYLAKIDSDGTLIWAKQAGGAHADLARAITVDATGNITLAARYTTSGTFGNQELIAEGDTDIAIARYNNSGSLQWAVTTGGRADVQAYDIDMDSNGNLYVTGQFNNTATFGSTNLSSDGYYDVFLTKVNNTGEIQWAKKSGGSYSESAYGLVIDKQDNIYITGFFSGSASFGMHDVQSYGADDMFLAKYNANGTALWANNGGSSAWDYGRDLTINKRGNPVVVGDFSGEATFGSQTTLNARGGEYDTDIFMIEYGPNGEVIISESIGGTSNNFGYGVTADNNHNVYISGAFFGMMSLEGTDYRSNGENDILIARYGVEANTMQVQASAINVNDTIRVTVSTDNAVDLQYYELNVNIDANKLEYVSTQKGGLFGQNAIVIAGEEQTGTIGASVGRTQGGVYGSGNLLTMTFALKQYSPQPAEISFTAQMAYNSQQETITVNPITTERVEINPPHMVWPGDADDNSVVDEVDVLALARHWGKQGTARQNASTRWEGQPVTVWNDTSATFADTDGNGEVNKSDLRAITFNFGETHQQVQPLNTNKDSEDSYPEIANNQLKVQSVGDTVSIGVKTSSYFEVNGLSTRIRVKNLPEDAYEIVGIEPGKWYGIWQDANKSMMFRNINSDLATIAASAQGLNNTVLINSNELLFTVKIVALKEWDADAEVSLNHFKALNREGEIVDADNDAVITDLGDDNRQPEHSSSDLPDELKLLGNYPNPFNPETRISFEVPETQHVTVRVYNMLGQEVATLMNDQVSAGSHAVNFRANELSSGMYIYRLTAGNQVQTKKMMLVK